ncbi:hypothetical protein DM860_011556 [Cuscuta australis]|uniref:Uncharacterized protein n=1 Tax=Cuscuta australis TaxID=267555 RepID=A0A328D205_9ASTE|nr:hypothetical protein DM860_011556 [Cuscuta australis]
MDAKEASFVNENECAFDHRFQRTDQWKPVYSWLESLDMDEVVKSKDILHWLTENVDVRDQLSSRHSRYHLMHYIKKCHVKILKRKGKVLAPSSSSCSTQLLESRDEKQPSMIQCAGNSVSNDVSSLPKENEVYKVKQAEAIRKYEILLEFEKQLLAAFPREKI